MSEAVEMETSETARRAPSPKPNRPEIDGVFPLMPSQYFDLISRRRMIGGERRLMFAVFEDAIRSYVMCMGAKSLARRREFEEVRAWMQLRGNHSVFSFDSLCSLFEIDPERLRAQLTTLQSSDLPRRRIGSLGRRVPMSAGA
ncbi:MAG TPA: hypothetical protein VN867_16660 [Candidatus Binataceae bacterium]|nr:hypothetical protein [Candidatus Binataceae bacterium]